MEIKHVGSLVRAYLKHQAGGGSVIHRGGTGKNIDALFTPKAEDMPYEYLEVVGTAQKAPFFSPAPLHKIARAIDMQLVPYLERNDRWQSAPQAWLVLLLRCCDMLLQCPKQLGEGVFALPLGDYCGLASVALPTSTVQIGDTVYYDVKLEQLTLSMVPFLFFDVPDEWVAVEYKTISPAGISRTVGCTC